MCGALNVAGNLLNKPHINVSHRINWSMLIMAIVTSIISSANSLFQVLLVNSDWEKLISLKSLKYAVCRACM